MRREGSPWRGVGVVTLKELSDHLTSARMRVLEWLVVLIALAALYGAIQQIRDVTAEDPFLLLRLFTTSREPLPSFVSFLSFLVPLIAIGLGFDAVNGEHNRRTLSRILSQPIYRDALLFGSVACARSVVLDRVPLGGHGRAGDAGALAVSDPDLAGARSRDRCCGSADAGRGVPDPGRPIFVTAVAEHNVWRGDAGDSQSLDPHAGADIPEPAAGGGHRRAVAAR